ncbi:MAG: SRPBCC family protein [Bacteroidetes bacterium]|nr:SRPBCC family protein [Bacteroidota bacterium]
MINIESNQVQVNSTSNEVFNFLNDLNNHRLIMPQSVSDWWSNFDEAKLKIQGIGSLHLKKSEIKHNSYIKIVPVSKAPVDLNIEWFITPDNNACNAKVVINAELNMFMKMVAEKPLKNIADYMAEHLKKHFC